MNRIPARTPAPGASCWVAVAASVVAIVGISAFVVFASGVAPEVAAIFGTLEIAEAL